MLVVWLLVGLVLVLPLVPLLRETSRGAGYAAAALAMVGVLAFVGIMSLGYFATISGEGTLLFGIYGLIVEGFFLAIASLIAVLGRSRA